MALDLVMAEPDDLDRVIISTLAIIGELDGADRVYITLYDGDGTFRNSHEWLRDGTPSHQDYVVDLSSADFPWSLGLAERGEVLNVERLEDIPPEGATERYSFSLFDVKSVMQMPMFVDGRLRGLIGCNKVRDARGCTEETLTIVGAIADAMAVALLRREQQRQLAEALDVAERAVMEKDDFLSRVTHELRTPLHAIVGFTELLQFERLPGGAAASVERIDEAGRSLLQLVDDLIALGSTSHSMAATSLPLRLAVERALERRRSIAASRGVHIALLPGLQHLRVRADETALAKVLDALVANAVTHAASGLGVEIDAVLDGDGAVITIRDHGAGIDPAIVETALSPTTNMQQWITEGRGVGVGLMMARSLTEQMGGALQLGNHPDGGVVAELRLPVERRIGSAQGRVLEDRRGS